MSGRLTAILPAFGAGAVSATLRERRGLLGLAVACAAAASAGCDYIVTPADESCADAGDRGRQLGGASRPQVAPPRGDLHVDLALRNDTGAWSAMQAATAGPSS